MIDKKELPVPKKHIKAITSSRDLTSDVFDVNGIVYVRISDKFYRAKSTEIDIIGSIGQGIYRSDLLNLIDAMRDRLCTLPMIPAGDITWTVVSLVTEIFDNLQASGDEVTADDFLSAVGDLDGTISYHNHGGIYLVLDDQGTWYRGRDAGEARKLFFSYLKELAE